VSLGSYTAEQLGLLGGLLRVEQLGLLGVGLLANERLVNMRNNTSAGDGGLDEGVELLIPSDGELQVARRDALHLEVLARIASQLQHLSREVLEDGSAVDGRRGTHAPVAGRACLEVAVDAPHRELEPCACRARDGLSLGLACVLPCLASSLHTQQAHNPAASLPYSHQS